MSTEYIEDLKRVTPKIAEKLNRKLDVQFLLGEAAARALSENTSDQRQRLGNAIDKYEQAVNDTIKRVKQRNMGIDIGVVIITVVLSVLAAVFSNVEGLATTAGISGVTIVSQVKTSADASKTYNSASAKLTNSVKRLRAALDMCGQDDKACLDKVQEDIKKAFDALEEAAKA